MMIYYYSIPNLEDLDSVRTWAHSHDNHSSLVSTAKYPSTQWMLVINPPPGVQGVEHRAELELQGKIHRIDQPE